MASFLAQKQFADQELTINSLKDGCIDDLRVDKKLEVDDIVEFGLEMGLLKDILKSFPDPRKTFDVPIEILLLPQIIQRLHDEHSLLLAPYMLNSAKLLASLGYNARVLEEGFNNKNTHPRETPFHGETLKHLLMSLKAGEIEHWYNTRVNDFFNKSISGRTRTYIIDGTHLKVPLDLVDKYPGAGVVKNSDGEVSAGYKVVWIRELIDQKGVIRALKFAPINTHDIEVGKELIKNFSFEDDAVLLMDRVFFDGQWLKELHEKKKIHICMPLKKNFELCQFAIARLEHEGGWRDHPSRKNQLIADLTSVDLEWSHCPIFKSGVAVKFKNKNNEDEHIIFVDTGKKVSSERILSTYDLRCEIEEDHRQMKLFQGLEKLPSKKYSQVVFRVVMGLSG